MELVWQDMSLDAAVEADARQTAKPSRAAGPIDRAHLARYTMGNEALEVEVLQLFAAQAPLTLADLETADSEKSWHRAAHTLKGSARAVGAWDVARAAEAAETAGLASGERSQHLAGIQAALAQANRYIAALHTVS